MIEKKEDSKERKKWRRGERSEYRKIKILIYIFLDHEHLMQEEQRKNRIVCVRVNFNEYEKNGPY